MYSKRPKIQGTLPEFAWKNGGKPQKTYDQTAGHQVKN